MIRKGIPIEMQRDYILYIFGLSKNDNEHEYKTIQKIAYNERDRDNF